MFEYIIVRCYGNDHIVENRDFDGDVEAVEWVMQRVIHTSCNAIRLGRREKDGSRMVLNLII